jgi:hypothetical protein
MQLAIDGLEVSPQSTVNLPSAGTVQWKLAPGLEWTPARGDKFEVITRYSVEDVTYPLKHNKAGVAVGKVQEHIVTEVVQPGVAEIIAVVTREQAQEAWDAQHAGQPEAANA